MFDWIARLYHGFMDAPSTTPDHYHTGDISKCPFHNPPKQTKPVVEEKEVEGIVEIKLTPPVANVAAVVPEETSVFPEFDRALKKFNGKNDLIVMSEDYVEQFDAIYKQKAIDLGKNLIVFPKGMLLKDNVAIISAGYVSYSSGIYG